MQKNSLISKNNGLNALHTLLVIILGVLVVFAMFRIFFGISYFRVYVVGTSMEGTLTGAESKYSEGGDYVYAFRSSSPRRGDIVVIKTSDNPDDEPIIKRVIALGGDRVELKSGVLYLNGEKVDEPYLDSKKNTSTLSRNTFSEKVVPEGYMFFMGDNRDKSDDSRGKYGMMPVSKTMGVVANWSLSFKGAVTAFNTFFDFRIGNAAGR